MKSKFVTLVLATVVALSSTAAFAYTHKRTHHYRSNSMNSMNMTRGQEPHGNVAGGTSGMSGTTSSKSGGGAAGGAGGGGGGQ